MRAKTKYHKLVVDLSNQLPKISKAQIEWANKNVVENFAFRLKNGNTTCLNCAYSWKVLSADDNDKCSCPNCNSTLTIKNTKQQKHKDIAYFSVLTTIKNHQVQRVFLIKKHSTKGLRANVNIYEIAQFFLSSKGQKTILARNRIYNFYIDNWCIDTDMSIKNYNNNNYIFDYISASMIYPKKKILEVFKRNGFNGYFYNIAPISLFENILNPKFETLIKREQIDIIKYFLHKSIDKYWKSICICNRHNYKIDDISIWIDYINNLEFLGKDLLNPKFICPVNLNQEHHKVLHLAQNKIQKELYKKQEKERIQNEIDFYKNKAKFFGIKFSDEIIDIKVLETIDEFKKEGQALNHCVYHNQYYNKPNSLILSAKINGQSIETIEVSLNTLEVIQARGIANKNSEFHDRIVNLVNSNMNLIAQKL